MPRKNTGVNSTLKPSYSELLMVNAALKKENAKLHKRIVKYQTQALSAENRIVALEEHFKEREHHHTPSKTEIENLDKLGKALAETLIIPKNS